MAKREDRISNADWKAVEEGLLALYAPNLLPAQFLPRSFALLRRLVPSEIMVFGVADTARKTLDITLSESHPAPEAGLRGYAECMGRYDLFNWNPAINHGAPFYRDDFFTRRQFQNLDIYCECYRYFGLDDHLALHIPAEAGTTIFFGIERGSSVPFTERDRAVLSKVQRHIANARSLALAYQAAPPADPEEMLPRFRAAGLTPRESEILFWVMEGKTLSEIGIILNIRRTTAKTHLESLYRRLGVENRIEALRKGAELMVASAHEGTAGSRGVFKNVALGGS